MSGASTKLDNPDADGNGEVHLYLARILRRILINFLCLFINPGFFCPLFSDLYARPPCVHGLFEYGGEN